MKSVISLSREIYGVKVQLIESVYVDLPIAKRIDVVYQGKRLTVRSGDVANLDSFNRFMAQRKVFYTVDIPRYFAARPDELKEEEDVD